MAWISYKNIKGELEKWIYCDLLKHNALEFLESIISQSNIITT